LLVAPQDVRQLLTGPEAASLCGVSVEAVRQWKRRGLIAPAGLDERNRPMYRWIDVARAEARTRARAGRQFAQVA